VARTVHALYRVLNYTLADAFRLQPGWGTQRHTAEGEKIPDGTSDALLVQAARQNTPAGYRLGSVTERVDGRERVLWSESMKSLIQKKGQPQ
jgi:hypothetical protein